MNQEFRIVDSVARENAEYVDGPALAYGDDRVFILEPKED